MGGVQNREAVGVEVAGVEGGAARSDGQARARPQARGLSRVEVGYRGAPGDTCDAGRTAGGVPDQVAHHEGVRSVGADQQVTVGGAAVGEGRTDPAAGTGVALDGGAGAAQEEAVAGRLGQEQAQADAVDVDAVGVQPFDLQLAEEPAAPIEPDVGGTAAHGGGRGEQLGVQRGLEECAQRVLRWGVEGDVVPAGSGRVEVAVVDDDVETWTAQTSGQGEPADPTADDDDAQGRRVGDRFTGGRVVGRRGGVHGATMDTEAVTGWPLRQEERWRRRQLAR